MRDLTEDLSVDRRGGRATLKDLASHAGVSVSTASLVMRDSPLVAAATRTRVLASACAVGYVRNRTAASLRGRMSYTIGLVVPEITNPFYAEFTAGIEAELNRVGWVAFLGNAAENATRQDAFLRRMREHSVDGIIVSPAVGTTPDSLRALAGFGLPCVQAIRYLPGLNLDHAGGDSRKGVAMATRHLATLGHRRIAFVGGGAATSASQDRRAGYLDGLSQSALPEDPALILDSALTRQSGMEILDRLVGLADPPTAAVCFADVIALGLIHSLLARGLRPGRDFAVVGHDDIDEAAWSNPGLSTVSILPRQLGVAAAQLLLKRLADPQRPIERVLIEPRLVIRGSCGATPSRAGATTHFAPAPEGSENVRAVRGAQQ